MFVVSRAWQTKGICNWSYASRFILGVPGGQKPFLCSFYTSQIMPGLLVKMDASACLCDFNDINHFSFSQLLMDFYPHAPSAQSCSLMSLLAPVSWDFGISSAVIQTLSLSSCYSPVCVFNFSPPLVNLRLIYRLYPLCPFVFSTSCLVKP